MRHTGIPLTGALALVLALSAAPLGAESPTPYPDFTFKRVKPPSQGGQKRITVQIDPAEQARTLQAMSDRSAAAVEKAAQRDEPGVTPQTPKAAPGPQGRYTWFWDNVSPEMAASGPGRLEPALTALSKPPAGSGVSAPRLDTLMAIARAQGRDILMTTAGTQVSPALVLAVIAVESAGRADAVSGAGAAGLMQLMPATAERFGVTDRLVPAQSIRGGVAFLNMLMQEFKGDPILVLAGYNAGEGAVRTYQGVPPYAETRDYVPKVLEAYRVARGLCMTPPMLISDGCVFRLPKA
ncbi:lytic transglycosylase domain-containing protein [Pseudooceanicola nanhaiensis]|uniref:lytic transglycosylase domain-containing protein n=1 Tax=Pseudooceanicola nanhaiensis TaxID=375761 RepID=UPI001CD40648|nr:lytic transglycosylase domain-containing protein [Pseudooceanicola nanhaiensis]MCA0919490.1 lytic transglycosylase domain-containing protein [Pseudooceanicola nanhaiensis]